MFLFLMVGVVLAGGYFYLNAQHPRVLADLKAKLLGSTSKPTASSPAPTGSGLTTAQIRTQWAEQALAESRLEDAERELKQAEELEPGTPAIQTLRKRLTEARITRLTEEAEQALAKGQFREADQRLDQAAVLDSGSIAVQAARTKVTEAKETQRRLEEERAEAARWAELEQQAAHAARAKRLEKAQTATRTIAAVTHALYDIRSVVTLTDVGITGKFSSNEEEKFPFTRIRKKDFRLYLSPGNNYGQINFGGPGKNFGDYGRVIACHTRRECETFYSALTQAFDAWSQRYPEFVVK